MCVRYKKFLRDAKIHRKFCTPALMFISNKVTSFPSFFFINQERPWTTFAKLCHTRLWQSQHFLSTKMIFMQRGSAFSSRQGLAPLWSD